MVEPSLRDLRAIAVPAYGPSILSAVGSGAIVPVVALSARDLGASVGTAAFMVALLGIGRLLGDLPAGAAAERFGERRSLMVASGIEFVGGAGCLFARQVWLLAVSILLIGVAGALFALARQAYLIDAVPIELRARALSTLGGVARIGLFFGPFVGALFIGIWGTGAAYVVDMIASVGAFLLVLLTRDITAHRRRAETADRNRAGVLAIVVQYRRVLATVGVAVLFISVARSCRTALVPLWAETLGLDSAHTSLVFGISGAVDMLLFYPSGAAMDRYGRTIIALPSMIILALGMVLLPLSGSFGTLTIVSVILGFGNGIGAGLVMTMGADASPVTSRTKFLAGWRLMSDTGTALGPTLIGIITIAFPLAVAALAMGALSLLGAGWAGFWVPRYDPTRSRD
ncbi:MAG: MFS transporter [Antricoccus sp.]